MKIKSIIIRTLFYGIIGYLFVFIVMHEQKSKKEERELELEQSYRGPGNEEEWEEKAYDELYFDELNEVIIEVKKDFTFSQIMRCKTYVVKEGAKDNDVGEIEIEYNEKFEKMKKVKAHITLSNGKKYKYKKMQDLAPYYDEPMYSSSRVIMISMPNVEPGSVIEWETRSVCFKPYMKNTFNYRIGFGWYIPVRKQIFKLIIPNSMKIKIKNLNINIEPIIEKAGNKTIYTWVRMYIDKFEDDDNLPDLSDIFEQINISTINSWEEVTSWYWELVNKNIKISDDMREKVGEVTADEDSVSAKIQAIIKYIQANFRYVSMSFGENNFEPHPSDEIFANKYGDCKDQTIVGIAMLKEIGVKAYACLYRDQESGDFRDRLPMPWYFDHVILCIEHEGKKYYTDVLIKGYRFTELQDLSAGAYLLVIDGEGGYSTQLPILEAEKDFFEVRSNIKIREDGSALIEKNILFSRYFSEKVREQWENSSKKIKREYLERLGEKAARGGKILKNEFVDMDKKFTPVRRIFVYENPRLAEVAGEYLIFGKRGVEREAMFTKKEREYDIFFRENVLRKSITVYVIPKNYRVVHLPKKIKINSEFESFERTYKEDGSKIIETQVRLEKRVKLPKSTYKKVQEYYNNQSNITKERIIIKRK